MPSIEGYLTFINTKTIVVIIPTIEEINICPLIYFPKHYQYP